MKFNPQVAAGITAGIICVTGGQLIKAHYE
jgi:hypothetical protein